MDSWAAPRAAAICPPPYREVLGSHHRVQADLRERLGETHRAGSALRPALLQVGKALLDLREAITAMSGPFDVQAPLANPEAVKPIRELSCLDSQPGTFRTKIGQQPID